MGKVIHIHTQVAQLLKSIFWDHFQIMQITLRQGYSGVSRPPPLKHLPFRKMDKKMCTEEGNNFFFFALKYNMMEHKNKKQCKKK